MTLEPPAATGNPAELERVFTVSFANLAFGAGATAETGAHAVDLGLRTVLLVADPALVGRPPVEIAVRSLEAAGVAVDVFDDVEVEPSETSFLRAAAAAGRRPYDGFVAVGGGSTIDTAKAANLYATHPAAFETYVNAPIGRGSPPPGALRPLIAIPTTAGTGSETTGVAIFDYRAVGAKTGIAHRRLRPTLGIVDPENTRSMPPMVTACSAFDVLCHALESYTAIPYRARPRPLDARARPAYQGANPFSDVWAETALRMVAAALPRVTADPNDLEARTDMAMAATYAGVGFGNAGVHLPHGMSYAVAGNVREFVAAGYPEDHPLVPHGMSVVLCAPAVVRFTAPAAPARHLRAAELLGVDVAAVPVTEAGEALAEAILDLMRLTGLPNGLADVGYRAADAPRLAEATLPQHRVTSLSPRPASREDLEALFSAALRYR